MSILLGLDIGIFATIAGARKMAVRIKAAKKLVKPGIIQTK
jgi:hypothetical protein